LGNNVMPKGVGRLATGEQTVGGYVSVDHILLVHGYSETSLSAYSDFPRILTSKSFTVSQVVLSAFNSLDDDVTIDDLALALEEHAQDLEAQGWNFSNAAVICHSTGSLVSRRWILNRRQLRATSSVPSHLITMAGANHGSTLAQVGKSVLGYVEKLLLDHVLSVGAGVLTDLDYGSDFLLRLNHEWLTARNGGLLDDVFVFSMGGDSIGSDPAMKFLWQTSEPGCDNTVRISGANLNYRFLVADPGAGTLSYLQPTSRAPHLIVPGKSHFGPATGILASIHDPDDPAFVAVIEALSVDSAVDYAAVQNHWDAQLATWMSNPLNQDATNGTLVFSVSDRAGHPVQDCFIGFLDQQTASTNVVASLATSSQAIIPHSPIHNNVERGSYSFYLSWPKYSLVNHLLHIEAQSGSPYITFKPVDYSPSASVAKMIQPNEFTYVIIKLDRDAYETYALYECGATLDLTTKWMPFPPGQIPKKP
jgi:hypothetical protein